MSVLVSKIKSSQYYDSALLMQLQKSLTKMDNILDVGVVMGTGSNKSVLELSGLGTPDVANATADDLIIVVKANDHDSAQIALSQVDVLLTAPKSSHTGSYRPKSLDTAFKMAPQSNWVCISINGKYAPEIVEKSLDANKNVFLFSDNVSVDLEHHLKEKARNKGLMVLGPDCGTAIINGVGFGFSNQVRKGHIGIVAASGTGLQAVTVAIDDLGEGISHGIGTGGRDLKETIGAITCLQAIDFLESDLETKVIVLISKPPEKMITTSLLQKLQDISKPIIVFFIGNTPPSRQIGNIHFALSLQDTAQLAVDACRMVQQDGLHHDQSEFFLQPLNPQQKYLRGLFSGGTLAYEVIGALKGVLPDIYSNISLDKNFRLKDVFKSQENTLLDLGEDEFTVGRLHPMMDNDLRSRRLLLEASDPSVAIIVLDIVLGFCAHPDAAGELAGTIKQAKETALKHGQNLSIITLVLGAANDPQNRDNQIDQLKEAGAIIVRSTEELVCRVSEIMPRKNTLLSKYTLNTEAFTQPINVINVGLDVFSEAFKTQSVPFVHVEWSPPANGNEYLISLLNELKG